MKQWDYKRYFVKRWKILTATVLFSWKESMTYSANLWGALWSTVAYITTYLMFLEAIFYKTQSIAGYNQNEILLLTVIVQISFLVNYTVSVASIEQLTELIRKGDLDLLLIKPLPHLFYVSIRKIDIWGTFINVIASVLPVSWMLFIKGGIEVTTLNLLMGIWIIIMGTLAIHGFQFAVNMLVFSYGRTKYLPRLAQELTTFGGTIPFEGFANWFKLVGLFLIPCLLPTALSASVMLDKTQGGGWVIIATIIAVFFLYIKQLSWEIGLKKYQSASS